MFRLDALVTGRTTGLQRTDDPGPSPGRPLPFPGDSVRGEEEATVATVRTLETTSTEGDTDATETAKTSRLDATTAALSVGATAVATATSQAAARLPDVAEQGRAVFADANRKVQAGSDQTLSIGTAVSFGFAVGLLIGGASRILVAAALIPVAMMGLTLLDRATRNKPAGRGAQ
jgi:hypothetical protein